MGLAAVPNGSTQNKKISSKTAPASDGVAKGLPQKKTSSKSSRKGWTLFILKQSASSESENSQKVEEEKPVRKQAKAKAKNYRENSQEQQQKKYSKSNGSPGLYKRNECCSIGDDGRLKGSEEKPRKERIRGLAAIVQDVLSRSRSELRREHSTKSSSQEGGDHRSTAKVVGYDHESLAAAAAGTAGNPSKDSFSAPETSLSFRMRLVDRCDTDLGVVAKLRNGLHKSPAASSIVGCEQSQSCRYPLQRPGEGASIVGPVYTSSEGIYISEGQFEAAKFEEGLLSVTVLRPLVMADLLERGKRLGIEDNSRVLTTRSSTTDEYECVVKRLGDLRGTIRLLAATAVREATRNSSQAREDLWRAGAIPPLVNLLQEEDMGICYMATVALLNLAIGSVRNKQEMADCGCIPILVRLMRPESATSVRESATTVILSLAASDQLKPGIGASGAIIYLSDILTNGTTQGRSDAVRALLNLSIFKGNRAIIVQAGVISPLYKVILRDAKDVAEKAVILLSHLFHDRDGKEQITAEEHSCSVLLQILKRGTFSQTCKEQTVVILLALSAKMAVRREAVFAQGILPCIVEIALTGSNPKIQDKAAKLLRIIKEQRLDQGILSMDRASVHALDDRLPLERQLSSFSSGDTSLTIPTRSKRRVTRSVSSLSQVNGYLDHILDVPLVTKAKKKDVQQQQLATKDSKGEVKSMNYIRSLFARSLRTEYLMGCRSMSIDGSSGIPVKFMRSFCSQG